MPDAAAMIRWWEVRGPKRGPISERDGWFCSYASDCPRGPQPYALRVRYVVTPDVGHHYCSAERRHRMIALDVQALWRDGERPSEEDVSAWEDLLLRCDVPDVEDVTRWALIQRYDDNIDAMVFKPQWTAAYIGEWSTAEHDDDGEREAIDVAHADWRV